MAELLMSNGPSQQLCPPIELPKVDFTLPDGWDAGRSTRRVIAIDDALHPDQITEGGRTLASAEDGISFTPGRTGGTLHVSLSDAGSFLHDTVLVEHAQSSAALRIARASVAPPNVREQLRLKPLPDKSPALTFHLPVQRADQEGALPLPYLTKDAVYTTTVPTHEIGVQTRRNSFIAETLEGLAAVALADLSYDEGMVMYKTTSLQHIVTRCMITACIGAGAYTVHHDIPVLYQIMGIPQDLRLWLEQRELPKTEMSTTYLSADPGEARRNGLAVYAPVTAPVRKAIDFINQCNIVARYDGRDLPFPGETLPSIAQKGNYYRGSLSRHKLRKSMRGEVVPTDCAGDLSDLMSAGPVPSASALTVALFEANGSDAQKREAGQRAALHIRQRPYLARRVLLLAASRGHAAPPRSREGNGGLPQLLTDLEFIGHIAGLPRLAA